MTERHACHADAVIRDLDVNVLVRRSDDTEIECAEALRHVGGNAQLARPAVHGVACVQGEVREDLRDLVRVGGDMNVLGDVDVHAYAGPEGRPRLQLPVEKERREVDALESRLGGTGVAEDLVGDALLAAGGPEDV